jgi:glucose-1-phosphate thymidylyltransferase
VHNSVLRGPLIIGRDSEVFDSEIGSNTSIGRDCVISSCRVEDSIIMENTRLESIQWPVVQSLIGRNVELRGAQGHNGGYRLTLGDHSRIEVPDA